MIHCWSISHLNTPLAIREQFALNADQQSAWLSSLDHTRAVVLSTCNRLELYVDESEREEMETLWQGLLSQGTLTFEQASPYTVKLSGHDAAHHLFKVAGGLKSMALGEPQILGQVAGALEQSQNLNKAGKTLSALFRAAIHTGKRVRNETRIDEGSVSVSSLGIRRTEQNYGSLDGKQILVIGAGEMGQAVIKGLARRRSTATVTLVSRTYERAQRLAKQWNITAEPITRLKELLVGADVVFTTSSAPFTILTCDDMIPVMQQRSHQALHIVDIAVPRDVETAVAEIPGVELHDIDDLAQVVDENLSERQDAIPHVEQIIHEEFAEFWKDHQGRAVTPTIRQLREEVNQIRQTELARIFNRLEGGNGHNHDDDEKVRALFEEFSHRFMNKVLHQPTHNLKAKASQGDGALFATITRDLFGLDS